MQRKRVLTLVVGLVALGLVVVPCRAGKPDRRADAPDDGIMGEYVGPCRVDGKRSEAMARVIGEGDGTYRVRLFTSHAWASKFGELTGKAEGKRVALAGELGGAEAKGTLEGGDALVVTSAKGEFSGKFTVRKSPTEGCKPPPGAVVLLPYEPGKKTTLEEWTNTKWQPMDDGSVLVSGGNNVSKKEFGSVRLHVEFRCPYKPKARGQGRGNSGVYLHGKYETQVLDSFGLEGKANEAGAIYGVSKPKVNPALPPTRWQTYDIVFHAPKLGAGGSVTKPPRFEKVLFNGVLVQENAEVTKTTTAGMRGKVREVGPLMLQDHGNPVRFRNIWYVPLDG